MLRIFAHAMIFAGLLLIPISVATAEGEPSVGAKGMAGAEGTFSFKPLDWTPGAITWWKDTDGVNPGEAGCHIGTDSDGKSNGRMFGEACLTQDQLVESNPGADVVHKHTDDVGHPDKFSCNAWCIGQGSKKGLCRAEPAPPCAQSARCICE
jgi:hypothetical protein